MTRKGLSRERVRDVLAAIDGGCMLSDLPDADEWVVNFLSKQRKVCMTRIGNDWWVQPYDEDTPLPPKPPRRPTPIDPPF